MEIDQLQKNLEEALEKIDILTIERDTLKDKYENAKHYIEKLKDKMDYLKYKKDKKYQIKDSN